MDKSSFGGIVLALVGIVGGLILEGGNIGQLIAPTAAMIVLGGTFGAVMVQFPMAVVFEAAFKMTHIFFEKTRDGHAVIKEILGYAQKARKEGIVSLDEDLEDIEDPFLKKSLMLAVDGTAPEDVRKMMELDMDNRAERAERIPQVFESAGGFAPTIGIIGAVIGLIQVMGNLDNIDEVGHGIAVAFVATIYGVGVSNLLFLPAAGKLKIRLREEQVVEEIMLDGVISILEGMNIRLLETKLMGYVEKRAESPEGEMAAQQTTSEGAA